VEEFLKFQDSQGTRRAYLTETAELAYGRCGEDGSWGQGLGEWAKEALIDTVGWSLIPLYRLTGPIAIFIMLGLLVWSIVKITTTTIQIVYSDFWFLYIHILKAATSGLRMGMERR
jgi:hypothetical protein